MAEEQNQVGKFDFLKKIFGKKSDNTVTSNAEESLSKNISPEKIGKSSEIKNGYTKNSAYLQILVENTMTFQQMAEDINISRQNVQKLVELMGGEKRTGADGKFITEQQKRVLAESQKNRILSLRKISESKSADTRIEPVDTKKEKSFLGLFGGYDKTKVNKRGKPRRPGALQRARRMRSAGRKRTIGKLAKVALSLTGLGKIGRLAKFGLLKTIGVGKYRSFAKMSNLFVKSAEKLAGTISKSIFGFLNTIGSAFTVKNIIGAFTKYFSMAAIFGVLFVAFKDTIMGFVKNISDKITDFSKMLKETFADIFNSALTKVKEFIDPFVKKVKDFIKSFKSRLKKIIQNGISLPWPVGNNIERLVKAVGLDKFVGLYDKEEKPKEKSKEKPKEVLKEEPKEDVITKPEEIITKPEPTPPTEPSDIFERIRQTQVPKKEEVTPTSEPMPTPEVPKVEPTPAPAPKPEVPKVEPTPAPTPERKISGSLAERMISTVSRAIGKTESGRTGSDRYDITFGDRFVLGRIVNMIPRFKTRTLESVPTAEEFSESKLGKKKRLSEFTLTEVRMFQAERDRIKPGSGAVGAYGFMPTVLFGKDRKTGGLVKIAKMDPNTTIFNKETQDELQKILVSDNVRMMNKFGIPLTPGYIYMAHYICAGGAREVYQSVLKREDITVADVMRRKGYKIGINPELEKIKTSVFEKLLQERLEKRGQLKISELLTSPPELEKFKNEELPQSSKKVSEAPIENQPVSIGSKISSASTEIAAERRIQQKSKVPVIVNAETVNNNIVQQNIVQNTVQPSNAARDLLSRASR